MKLLKRIHLGSDTNLFAINAIVHRTAFLYLDVTVHSDARGDREIKLPVTVNPNVPVELRMAGVRYGIYMPVLACHPISDTEFYTELGYTEVDARYFDLELRKCTHWAYMGLLPNVVESDPRDARYVAPLRVYEIPKPKDMPDHYRHYRKHGASLRTDYLRTSALDSIDDEMWAQLIGKPNHGMSWSQFLEAATSGRFTPHDDLSNCLEALDQEYVPEHIVKRLRLSQFERRMKN